MGGTIDTEQEKSINALYLGHTDNGSGHIVFKLDTKAVISVNRVVVIPTPRTIINQVNQMGASENQPEGIQFTDMNGKVTINILDLNCANDNDNNSNETEESFDHDKEYQKNLKRRPTKMKILQPMKLKKIIFGT